MRELSFLDEQGTGAAVRRFYVDGNDAEKPLPPEAPELKKALQFRTSPIVRMEFPMCFSRIRRIT